MSDSSPQARLELIEHINDQVDVFLAYVDQDLRYVYNNAQYQRWFSRTVEDLRGLEVREVVGEQRWRVVESRYRRALAGEAVREVNSFTLPDGSTGWGRIEFLPDADPKTGEVAGILILVSNVTALKRVEQELLDAQAKLEERVERRTRELHTREQQLRSVTDAVPAGIAFFDASHRCEFANRTLSSWLAQPSALLGQDLDDALQLAPARFRQAARRGQEARAESLLEHEGEERFVQWHAVPLEAPDGTEGPGGLSVLVQDLTERRRRREHASSLYAQMGEAQRTESLALLTRGLAHDFKNLLQAVIGNLSMASDASRDDVVGRFLDNARRNAEQAIDFCAVLQAFSGDRPARPRFVDLGALAQELVDVVSRRPDCHHSIEVAIEPQLPPLAASEVQLKRALYNLLLNAQEATPPKGMIQVSLRAEHADTQLQTRPVRLEPGDYLVLTVRDSGHGMDALTRDRLFETFYTTRPSGKGLGLAVVLSIVQAHGGGIRVQSQVEEGTEIEIWLPTGGLGDGAPSLPRRASASATPRGWALVARNDLQDLLVSAEALRQQGFRVMTASTADEAVDLAQRKSFDLVLVDPMLTAGSGSGIADTLLSTHPDLPIIIAADESAPQLSAARRTETLREPWYPEDLLAVVDRLLSQSP